MVRITYIGVLIVTILFVQNWSVEAQNPFCDPYTANVVNQADLPPLPDVFDVRVESNFVSKNFTADSFQIYDSIRRRAAVQMYANNIEFRFIFNYALNEVYRIERIADNPESPTVCEAQSLVDAPETPIFFGYYFLNSTYIVPGTPNDVLRFPKTGQVYNGTETHRGIPCDVYLSCQYNDALKANYRVKFFFSKKGYAMPYLIPPFMQVPVRAEVEGIYFENNIRIPFKTNYDFHEFNPQVNGYASSFFDTPYGVFCKNRKLTKPTPKVSERYAYSEEIVQIQTKSILHLKRVYYDSLFKLVRYDIRNTQRVPETLYVVDPLTIINDYTLGVSYYINQNLGNCSFKGIGFDTFGTDLDLNYTEQSINQGFGISVRIKSPSSFLLLDSDYIYTGEKFEHDVLTDVFISNRTDTVQGVTINSFYEYSFRMPWTTGDVPNPVKSIPSRLSIYGDLVGKQFQFNYYSFENDLPDYSVYDTSQCYPTDTKINFRVSFSYKDILTASDFKNSFVNFMEQFLYYVLSVELNETAMRFAPPRISVGNDGLFFAVSAILPPLPVLSLFNKWDGKWLTGTDFVSTDADSAERCANFCNNVTECLSFDYCPETGRCFANKRHVTDNSTNLSASSCQHFSRTTDNVVKMKDARDVWTLLQNSVALGLFRLEIPIATLQGIKTVNFTATGVSQIVENNQFGSTNLLNRFDLLYGRSKYLTQKERYYTGLSADECAARCNREDRFVCESFDYCWVSGECRLSKFQPTDLTDIVVADSCDIYAKDALYHYDRAPFAVSVSSKDLKLTNIESAKDCAVQCDTTTKIHCRGFNYCDASKTCYLTETHLLDASEGSTVDLVCTHYTRNYIKDFSYTSSGNITTTTAEIIYGNSGIELCARACVGADGFSCKSFDYCPGSRKCLLHNNNRSQVIANPGDLNVESCDNYIREYFYLTSTTVNVKYPTKKDNSEATLIGLAVTFSIASVIGGFLIFLFVLPKFIK